MEKLVVAAEQSSDSAAISTTDTVDTREINASGHPQELERNFGLLSICGIGIITGNSWTALGGSIVCSSSRVHQSSYTDILAEVASYRSLRYTMAVQPARFTSCSSIPRSSPRAVQLIMHQYCCIMLLHVHRCFHCRAGISHAVLQRRFVTTSQSQSVNCPANNFYSISLGINYGRALWKGLRLVCWLVEFPGVGCWHCVNVAHSRKPDCFNVCGFPSGFGSTKVARLRELPHLHMDLLRHRPACQ